jgi:3-hydroxy acid dehydrogenase/malonic semialdehyde reductase
MDLNDTTVMITGASSGIGAACAEAFAPRVARLVLTARRQDRLEALAAELCEHHDVEVRVAGLDIRSRDAVEATVADLEADGAAIDVLVNNAGLARGLAPVQDGAVADWEEMIDTNLRGLLVVTRAVLRSMVARRRGHVINIGSIAGHEVYPKGAVYCATKHAVAALSRGLAIDTLGTGVRVSSVDPGMVETEFSLVRFHGDGRLAGGVYAGMTPLTAADVAEAVVFCATRPPHANVREMILMPAAQASATQVFRREREE